MQELKTKQGIRLSSTRWSIIGLLVGVGFFLVTAYAAYSNVIGMRENEARIRNTHEVLTALDELLIATLNVESGQRGFVITGEEEYLEPYRAGVEDVRRSLPSLEALTQANEAQGQSFGILRSAVETRLGLAERSVQARRDEGFAAAIEMIDSDRGKIAMDAIRQQIAQMNVEEGRERQQRVEELAAASRAAILGAVITSLIGIGLTVAIFIIMARSNRTRERQGWLQAAQVELSEAMRGEKTVPQVAAEVLSFLAERTGANAGALFKGESGTFDRVASLGVADSASVPESFGLNEGLLGKVAADARATTLSDIPAGYLKIGSALGSEAPRHLVVAPIFNEGSVNAVVEFGFFDAVDDRVLELLDNVSGSIGVALRSARFRELLQEALEETQRQAAELQAQSEELRVSNEELEEQGNALKESQARLELQQVELEQTNSQLDTRFIFMPAHTANLYGIKQTTHSAKERLFS